jgi:hypothetical protein
MPTVNPARQALAIATHARKLWGLKTDAALHSAGAPLPEARPAVTAAASAAREAADLCYGCLSALLAAAEANGYRSSEAPAGCDGRVTNGGGVDSACRSSQAPAFCSSDGVDARIIQSSEALTGCASNASVVDANIIAEARLEMATLLATEAAILRCAGGGVRMGSGAHVVSGSQASSGAHVGSGVANGSVRVGAAELLASEGASGGGDAMGKGSSAAHLQVLRTGHYVTSRAALCEAISVLSRSAAGGSLGRGERAAGTVSEGMDVEVVGSRGARASATNSMARGVEVVVNVGERALATNWNARGVEVVINVGERDAVTGTEDMDMDVDVVPPAAEPPRDPSVSFASRLLLGCSRRELGDGAASVWLGDLLAAAQLSSAVHPNAESLAFTELGVGMLEQLQAGQANPAELERLVLELDTGGLGALLHAGGDRRSQAPGVGAADAGSPAAAVGGGGAARVGGGAGMDAPGASGRAGGRFSPAVALCIEFCEQSLVRALQLNPWQHRARLALARLCWSIHSQPRPAMEQLQDLISMGRGKNSVFFNMYQVTPSL